MSIIVWIVLGLIAGFIASKIVNKQGQILDIVLGVVGAIVGGWLFSMLGAEGISGVNIYSIFVAVIGAIVVLFAYHDMINALPADRTDQPFSITVLPWGARRGRPIANAH